MYSRHCCAFCRATAIGKQHTPLFDGHHWHPATLRPTSNHVRTWFSCSNRRINDGDAASNVSQTDGIVEGTRARCTLAQMHSPGYPETHVEHTKAWTSA